jgi:hypothetical protein
MYKLSILAHIAILTSIIVVNGRITIINTEIDIIVNEPFTLKWFDEGNEGVNVVLLNAKSPANLFPVLALAGKYLSFQVGFSNSAISL